MHIDARWLALAALSCAALEQVRAEATLERSPAEVTSPKGVDPRARNVTILTSAAVPWLTGTASNPILRGVSLAKLGFNVSFVLPWVVDPAVQKDLYKGKVFPSRTAQEQVIRSWVKEGSGINISTRGLQLRFYWYDAIMSHPEGSLVSTNPLAELPEDLPRDMLIAEEPDHMGMFDLSGTCWKGRFKYVVGIMHTNYDAYFENSGMAFPIRQTQAEFIDTILLQNIDLSIKLSDFPMLRTSTHHLLPEAVENVHGVPTRFFEIGRESWALRTQPSNRAYFIGKATLAKYSNLLLLAWKTPDFQVDSYGSGADEKKIARLARAIGPKLIGTRMRHHPGMPHTDPTFNKYGVLVNPSTSEVLSTVTMEALAMGKRVVLAQHPTNDFFIKNFPDRVYFYLEDDIRTFMVAYRAAMMLGGPRPLPAHELPILTWEAATQRLLNVALPAGKENFVPSRARLGEPEESCLQLRQYQSTLIRAWRELTWSGGVGSRLPRATRRAA